MSTVATTEKNGSKASTKVASDKPKRERINLRQRLTGGSHSRQVGVRFSDAEIDKLVAEAASAGATSMSNYIRHKCGFPTL